MAQLGFCVWVHRVCVDDSIMCGLACAFCVPEIGLTAMSEPFHEVGVVCRFQGALSSIQGASCDAQGVMMEFGHRGCNRRKCTPGHYAQSSVHASGAAPSTLLAVPHSQLCTPRIVGTWWRLFTGYCVAIRLLARLQGCMVVLSLWYKHQDRRGRWFAATLQC